jgi:non-homologous end joining protein Ku
LEELALMTKIMDKMTKDLDLRLYHDGYRERIEALIESNEGVLNVSLITPFSWSLITPSF